MAIKLEIIMRNSWKSLMMDGKSKLIFLFSTLKVSTNTGWNLRLRKVTENH
jgi:hypothetical protein